MATNGQLKTNVEYESYFWVKWEQSGSQDIPNNRTEIAWSCGVTCGHTFKLNAIKMSAVTINGVQVYDGGTYSNFSAGDHTIASGTMWISHNDTDGTKTFSVSSFTGWLYSNHNYSCNGGSFTLTAIPRKAMITATADFTDTGTPSITFSNPGGFPMDVWLEPNPVGDHLCVRNGIPNTGSYTWTDMTDAERDELRNHCKGTECTIRIGLYTHIGETTYADYKDMKFTVTENPATKPVVSVEISLNNNGLPYPENFGDMYIQGKSMVNVTSTSEGKYGATILNHYVVVDGKSYNSKEFLSEVLMNSGDVDITVYAKDSRGFTGSAKKTINVAAYSKSTVVKLETETAILCYRSDDNGIRVGNSESVWIKAKRSYNDLGGKNTCALQWRWKLATDELGYTGWKDLIPAENTTTDEYSDFVPGKFDLTKAYTIQICTYEENFGELDIKTFELPTRDVALHLGAGGKKVAIGTYCGSNDYTFLISPEWTVYIGDQTLRDYILSVINEGG